MSGSATRMGGLVVRLHAHEHPESASAGMVLVDDENENQNLRLPEALSKVNEQGMQMLRGSRS